LKILAMTRKLASHFDLDSMLVDVVEVGKSLLDAERGSLWLYEEDVRELVMVVPRFDPPMRDGQGAGRGNRRSSSHRYLPPAKPGFGWRAWLLPACPSRSF